MMDPKSVQATKCAEFNVKSPDDKEDPAVMSVLPMTDKIVIVDKYNNRLKLYDKSGTYLSFAEVKYLTLGVTHVHGDTFATCGHGNKVFLWTVRDQTIICEKEAYDVEYKSISLFFNGTFYCVLHRYDKVITVLDKQGRGVRKIRNRLVLGKKYEYGFDIHVDHDTNNIYTPCIGENSGILCLTIQGEVLWFTPLEGAWFLGITEIKGLLCVPDSWKHCLHLISKTGAFEGKLLDKDDLGGLPYSVCYDDLDQKLYMNYDYETKMGNTIAVFKLSYN